MFSKVRRLLLLAIIAVAVLSLGSCDFILGVIFPNQFVLNGTSYDLENMYVISYGQQTNGAYDLDVVLTSPGLSLNSSGYFSGSGNYVYLDLGSARSDVAEGDYGWDDYERAANTIVAGESGVGSSYAIASSGTVTVKRPLLGGYELEWSLNTDKGSLEGHFRGDTTAEYDGSYASVVGPAARTK